MMKDQMTNINYDESNAAKLSSMFSEFENYSYKDLIIAESCMKQMNLVIPKYFNQFFIFTYGTILIRVVWQGEKCIHQI